VAGAWAGPGAVFCDRTSAYLHGLIERRPERVDVCSERRLRHPEIRAVRRSLDAHDVVVKERLPITHPCRALIDLAGVVDEETLEAALHLGLNRHLFTRERLERRILSLTPQGKKAIATLRELVNVCPKRPPESTPETRAFRILRKIAPPMPETQYWIVLEGERFRLDFAYPNLRKNVECDSHLFHTRPEDFERNLRKRAMLRRAGWDVFAVSAKLLGDEPLKAEVILRDFVHGPHRLDI
jgi:hypothetical protein